jgi:hypothetical protein
LIASIDRSITKPSVEPGVASGDRRQEQKETKKQRERMFEGMHIIGALSGPDIESPWFLAMKPSDHYS